MKIRYLLLLLIIAACTYSAYRVQYTPYDNPVEIVYVPTFTQVPLPFTHDFNSTHALPYAGGAIIEVDNDSIPEIFISGGYLQRDGLYTYKDGEFKDISIDSGLSKDIGDTSYGAASIDINEDGYIDLLVTRDSGLYLYLNGGGFFTKHKLNVEFAATETPVSIALADINRDGLIDIFVSCFTTTEHLSSIPFSPHTYPANNKLLLNNGGINFIDITKKAGLPERKSAHSAVFADFNGDSWPDLVVAYQSEPAALYKNVNGYQFEPVSIAALENMAFANSVAISDINNDSKPDLLLTTTGSTLPGMLLQQTLQTTKPLNTEWLLLANQGGFKFNNVAKDYLLAEYELATSAAFADFNLDGLQDIVVGQNMVDFWPYMVYRNPGKLLIQKDRDNFAVATKLSHISNRNFAADPLLADFNLDGYMDLVWLNLNGPAQAFINNGGNSHYLQIDLGDNPAAIGAKAWLQTNDNRILYAQQIASAGMSSDHSHLLTFAINQESIINRLEIKWPDGRTLAMDEVETKQLINLRPQRLDQAKPLGKAAAPGNEQEIEELVETPAEPEAPIENLIETFEPGPEEEPEPAAKAPEPSIEDDLEDFLSE